MVLLQSKINGRVFTTEFYMGEPQLTWVKNVLKCLEGKNVAVPDPSKKWYPPEGAEPLCDGISCDDTKYFEVYNRYRRWMVPNKYYKKLRFRKDMGLIYISILKWLPTVLGKILIVSTEDLPIDKFGQPAVGHFQGSYKRIIFDTFFFHKEKIIDLKPYYWQPEIHLSSELLTSEDAFCFVLAHEIQHAINWLEIAYPVIKDFEGFKHNILDINNSEYGDFTDVENHFRLLTDIDLDDEIYVSEWGALLDTFGDNIHKWGNGFYEFQKLKGGVGL